MDVLELEFLLKNELFSALLYMHMIDIIVVRQTGSMGVVSQ